MKILETTQATAPLAEYVDEIASGPIILTVEGKPVAALVAIENADLETVTLSTHPQFLALIERSRAHQAANGGITPDEMRQRLNR